jgi:hypothetical protein
VRDFHGVYVPAPTPFRGDGIEEIKEILASAGLL